MASIQGLPSAMFHIAITTADTDGSGVQTLLSAAKSQGIDVCVIDINQPDAAEQMNAEHCIIVRVGPKGYFDYRKLLPSLDVNHQRLIKTMLIAFDKSSSMKLLQEAGVPMPESRIVDALSQPEQPYPYILKVPIGNQGEGVYLIEAKDDLRNIAKEHASKLIQQEYIAESKGRDKRLFVVDGKVVASMTRTSQTGDFRANLHKGGVGQSYQPTAEEIAIAQKAVELHGLLFAGVDIIDSKRGPLVLEVNPSPGFGIEEVVKVDIAIHIMESIKTLTVGGASTHKGAIC